MSKFLNRKALVASALILGVLSVVQVPGALASGAHAEQVHLAAPAADKAASAHMGHAADAQKMDHAAMAKGSMADAAMDHSKMAKGSMADAAMDHSKMAHGTMKHEHNANPAAADNHHDQ